MEKYSANDPKPKTEKASVENDYSWTETQEGRDEKVQNALIKIKSGIFLSAGQKVVEDFFSGLSRDEENKKKIVTTLAEYYGLGNGEILEIDNEAISMPNVKVKIVNTGEPITWDENMGLVLRHYVQDEDGKWNPNARRSPLLTALSEISKEKERLENEKRTEEDVERYLV